jgi:hypothetical protein
VEEFVMAGWRTDWLYRLVFKEVAAVWEKVRSEGRSLGTPPDWLCVQELRRADWENLRCLGPVRRAWSFRSGGLSPLPPEGVDPDCGEPRGMFYQVGRVRFHIADRKRLVFEYTVGPRYGRGVFFRVAGQGKRGRLHLDGPLMWVS